MQDTRRYEVQYIDGTTETVSANTITGDILSQVNTEGHRNMLFDEIIDRRSDSTHVAKDQSIYHISNCTPRNQQTTKGCKICSQWIDGSSNWIPLKNFKASYPVQQAEYAIERGIQDEAASA